MPSMERRSEHQAGAVSRARCRVVALSEAIVEEVVGEVRRGCVHSVFAAAANILFPGDVLLSLNANGALALPNGLCLSAPAGAYPFSSLRAGMTVLLGAQRLHIEAIGCSLDLSTCARWSPYLQRPPRLERVLVERNATRLRALLAADAQKRSGAFAGLLPPPTALTSVSALAEALCGQGPGLTPAGDDMLAGWMAAGWLLLGPRPEFLAACREIAAVAVQRTHLLSRAWLEYAARGAFALPVLALLEALASPEEARLMAAARAVLDLGASSGCDLLQGLLLFLDQPLLPW
jgi:hypothetical protein